MPMRCGVSLDNETACKKVRNYQLKSDLAATHSLAHLLSSNNGCHRDGGSCLGFYTKLGL